MSNPDTPAPAPENLDSALHALYVRGEEFLIGLDEFKAVADTYTQFSTEVREELIRLLDVLAENIEGNLVVGTWKIGFNWARKTRFPMASGEFTQLYELLTLINQRTVTLPGQES